MFLFFIKSKFLVSSEGQFLNCVNMFYSVQHLILDDQYELYFIKIVIGGKSQLFFLVFFYF